MVSTWMVSAHRIFVVILYVWGCLKVIWCIAWMRYQWMELCIFNKGQYWCRNEWWILIRWAPLCRFFEAGGQGRVENDFDVPLYVPVISFPELRKYLHMESKKSSIPDKKPIPKLVLDSNGSSADCCNKHLKKRRNARKWRFLGRKNEDFKAWLGMRNYDIPIFPLVIYRSLCYFRTSGITCLCWNCFHV